MAVSVREEGVYTITNTGSVNNFDIMGLRIPFKIVLIGLAIGGLVGIAAGGWVAWIAIALLYPQYKMDKEAIILNLNTKTISWPVFDFKNYFKGSYPRKEIPVAEILSIDGAAHISVVEHTTHYEKKAHHYLTLTGPWGTKKIWFPSEEDRDQCYALIVTAKEA
jgi:hypothetical protein